METDGGSEDKGDFLSGVGCTVGLTSRRKQRWFGFSLKQRRRMGGRSTPYEGVEVGPLPPQLYRQITHYFDQVANAITEHRMCLTCMKSHSDSKTAILSALGHPAWRNAVWGYRMMGSDVSSCQDAAARHYLRFKSASTTRLDTRATL